MNYFKFSFLIACCFLINQKTNAQYFDGGLLFGLTVSQIDGDRFGGYHQPGLTGGVYSSREFKRNFSGQLELKYTAKGARATGGKDDPMLYEQKLRYVELPVKAKYFWEKYKCDLEIGICTGYLFQESGSYNNSDTNTDEPNNKLEMSWIAGGSYHVNDHLLFSVQFSYSLLPIRNYENSNYNYGFLSRAFSLTKGDYNNVIEFMLYYRIGKR